MRQRSASEPIALESCNEAVSSSTSCVALCRTLPCRTIRILRGVSRHATQDCRGRQPLRGSCRVGRCGRLQRCNLSHFLAQHIDGFGMCAIGSLELLRGNQAKRSVRTVEDRPQDACTDQ